MADQISLRRETNLYDDETIKAVNDKVTSQYAVSTTASATVAKTATVDGTFTLFKNARVSVFFQNANTSTSPTLNVAGTGAKPIWAYGGPLSADGNTFNWVANSTIEFVYDGEHWLVADSGAVGLISKYDEKLTQEAVFNKLTNNGAIRGIFMKDGQMYINMDYLQTGTLKLGGANNGNGLLVVYDASGAEVGRWDKDGVSALGTFESIYEWYYDPGPGGGTARTVTTKTLFDSGCVYFYGDAEDTYAQAAIGLSNILRPGYGGFTDPTTAPLNITVNYGGAIYFVRRTSSGNYWKVLVFDETHQPQINSTSSKRFKHDITDQIDEDLNAHKLYKLHMKQFVYNDDHIPQYQDMAGQTLPGFIAEDVEEIYPSAVIHDWQGQVESWDERRIIPGMLALIQEQKKQLDEQAERIKKLESNTSFIHMV